MKKEAFIGAAAKGLGRYALNYGKAFGKTLVENPFQGLVLESTLPFIRGGLEAGADLVGVPDLMKAFVLPMGAGSNKMMVASNLGEGAMKAKTLGQVSRKKVQDAFIHPSLRKQMGHPLIKQGSSMNKIAAAARRRYHMEKTGSRGQLLQAAKDMGPLARQLLGYGALGVGLGTMAPLAAYGVGKTVKKLNKVTVNRDFKKVLKEDPSLKNDKEAQKHYKVLHSISPYIAREPAVAARVVRTMGELPDITPATYNEILRLEKSLQDTAMPFLNVRGGGKAFGVPFKDLAGMAGE